MNEPPQERDRTLPADPRARRLIERGLAGRADAPVPVRARDRVLRSLAAGRIAPTLESDVRARIVRTCRESGGWRALFASLAGGAGLALPAVSVPLAGGSLAATVAAAIGLFVLGALGAWVAGRARLYRSRAPELALARAFDDLVDGSVARLPPRATDELSQIRSLLERLLAQLARTRGTIAPDDDHFVRESAARYLPDAITAYLTVTGSQRAADAAAAVERTLVEQLVLVRTRLAEIDDALAKSAARALDRNREFLARRTRS